MTAPRVPVIALTGFLGAGKTTVLNSILRAPGARFGVVVNDFGTINVDAALITGQIDEAASIAGGCLCCMEDDDELDEALEALSDPRLHLDAILVEASGVAEPLAVARLLRLTSAERTRPGGVIEVVDSLAYFETVDRPGPRGGRGEPPLRFASASLVVLTKTAMLDEQERARAIEEISARIRLRNEDVPILEAPHGRIDPALVTDVARAEDPPDQLPIAAVTRQARAERDHHDHLHADAVTVRAPGPVDPGAVLDLFESPRPGCTGSRGRSRSARRAGRATTRSTWWDGTSTWPPSPPGARTAWSRSACTSMPIRCGRRSPPLCGRRTLRRPPGCGAWSDGAGSASDGPLRSGPEGLVIAWSSRPASR